MKVVVTHKGLTVKLSGWERVWALKKEVSAPIEMIERVEYTSEKPQIKNRWHYLRFPGTAIPGIFLAGTYVARGTREFWYLNINHPGMLSVTLRKGEARYDEIRLSVTPETAAKVVEWWGVR